MFPVKDDSFKTIKYAGRSKAKVIDSRDPLKRGRIRVDHPLLGDTGWIPYLRTNSTFDPPSIGDIVYVEVDGGQYTHPLAWGNLTKGLDIQPNIPEEFRREVPTNRGIFTPGGHKIELDDGIAPVTTFPQDKNFTTENRGIRITSVGGNKIHIVEDSDNSQQYILINDANGNSIRLDYSNNTITIVSVDKIVTASGGDTEQEVGGDLTINVTGEASINASVIKLNGASGDVVTSTTSPVIDSIYGQPQLGVPTVKAG
jgi:hypothetical protein